MVSSDDPASVDAFTVDIGRITSVEIVNHYDRHTESTTVEKKKGAIGRAVVGELMFGGVGAIVGATSAGSIANTTGKEHSVYLSSELIFGLSSLDHPVLRFVSEDPVESDKWVYRVRAAMAAARSNGA